MKVAVEGCCHGELDKIYETLQHLEKVNNIKVDLLLICGDFQAIRNRDDFKAMAVPPKYQKLNTFYKYYSGEKVAPVLTIFIGGNHEASNYMQELPYGGWVAKNIYYMGYGNVISVGGLRIGGLSGIYKERDYHKGHYEHSPYTEETKRSVYHIRSIEVFRLKQLRRPLDIFMSHDWPTEIARYGDMHQLFSKKSFLKAEVLDGTLGSPPAGQLLHKLQPSYWFSAHLHVKYTAQVQHAGGNCTKFLALDKCLPRRQFLQVLDFPDKGGKEPPKISLDPEWLCILQKTNHLMHLGRSVHYMPGPNSPEWSSFEVTDGDIAEVTDLLGGNLALPENFKTTAPTLEERERHNKPAGPLVLVNPQTSLLCTMLDLTDPNAVHLGVSSHDCLSDTLDPHELEILRDSSGDDDPPTDVSSSVNTTYVNSSLDMSDMVNSPCHPSLTSSLSAGSFTAPSPPQVDDDDEEFKAILAAQRRHSLMKAASSSDGQPAAQKRDSASDGEFQASSPSSQKTAATNDNNASHSPETAQNSEDSAATAGDKSSSDIDSTSQDSQDELCQPQYGGGGPQNCSTDCVEVSAGTDSPSQGRLGSLAGKHPSPTSLCDISPAIKKLKRRNVSMYSSSGTEDEPC